MSTSEDADALNRSKPESTTTIDEQKSAPADLLKRARDLISKNRYKEAIPDLDALIKLDANCSKAYVYRARALGFIGEIDACLQDLDRAIALDDGMLETKARLLYDIRRYREAVEAINLALEQKPNDIALRMMLASSQLYLHDYDAGVCSLEKILDIAPELAHNSELEKIKNKLELDAWLRTAINKQTPDSELHHRFNRLLLRFGCYQEALQQANRALQSNPDSTAANAQKALALSHLSRDLDAIYYFVTAIKKGSDEPFLYINYALVLMRQHRYEEALNAAEKALQQQSKDASSLCVFALAEFKLGNLSSCIETCSQSLRCKKSVFAYLLKSIAERRLNDLESALDSVNSLLALPRSKGLWYAYRACLLIDLDRFEEASEDFSEASRKNMWEVIPDGLRSDRSMLSQILMYQRPSLPFFKTCFDDPDNNISILFNRLVFDEFKRLAEEWQLDEQIRNSPSWFRILAKGAALRKNAGNWVAALDHYSTAIAMNPNGDPILFALRGDLHLDRNSFESAEQDADRALSMLGLTPATVVLKARILMRTGRTLTAKKLCQEALDSHKSDPLLLAARSLASFALNEIDQALADSELAMSHANGQTAMQQAFCARGKILWRTGRLKEALGLFDMALALKPDCYVSRVTGALLKFLLGQKDEAFQEIESILAEHPNFADGLIARAEAFKAMGKAELALDSINQAIALAPLDGELYYSRFLIRKDLNDSNSNGDAYRARDLEFFWNN